MKKVLLLVTVIGLTVVACKKSDVPSKSTKDTTVVITDTVKVEGDSAVINVDTVK